MSEVIVSDDGDDGASRAVVREFGEPAVWTAGPQRGLGPNRNHALTLASGTYVLFLDDDARLGDQFLREAIAPLPTSSFDPGRTIVTGIEQRPNGDRITAHEQDFLGYQHRSYRDGEAIRTVVINSALFPRALFDDLGFDEQLVYGYDEVDLASRAVAAGYRIVSASDAVNTHNPSEINRDYYRPRTDAARLYVTAKRRWVTERSPLRAGLFLGAAVPHLLISALRGRNQVPLSMIAPVTIEALTMLRRHRRNVAS